MKQSVPQEVIENKILMIRGRKVMLDSDLAALYEVTTFNLNKAVQRNLIRFPKDFMFRLNKKEFESLIFQFGMSKKGRGGRRYLPYVFTEQGVAMLSGILNSERAILVNIAIMRAFVKLREILSTHRKLAHKMSKLETRVEKHDGEIRAIFEAIRQLMAPPDRPRPWIGFHP